MTTSAAGSANTATTSFDFKFSAKLAFLYTLSRLKFIHGLLPEKLRDQLPTGWNNKMFWTAFSTGGNKIYYDLYCRSKEPASFQPKAQSPVELKLTEEQIKFFHDNGYIGPFDFLSPEETKEIQDYCFKVVESESQVYSFSKGEYSFQEGKKNALLGGYDKLTEENKQYFSGRLNLMDRHLDSPKILKLLKRPEIVERCAQILGENLILWRSQFFTKTPRKAGTTWHQANVWLFDDFKVSEEIK